MVQLRGTDKWGQGHFGASRGGRKHMGVDVCCEAGDLVKSYTPGTVTKIGYPYDPRIPGKEDFRYVQVTFDGNHFRYFYLTPTVFVGQRVLPGDCLGVAQDLTGLYPDITPHFHFEIIDPHGQHVDPKNLLVGFDDEMDR